MPHYEYRVLPAPEKGRRAKGVKGVKARFALAVEDLMNDMGADGWEYLRADTLPSEERAGLTGSVTEWRTLLVFRRARLDQAEAFQPRELPGPKAEHPGDAAQTADDDGFGAMLKERAAGLVPVAADVGGPADGVAAKDAEGNVSDTAPDAGSAPADGPDTIRA